MNGNGRVRSMHVITVMLGLSVSACIPLPGGRTYESLPVVAKQGANVLVASGGSTCAVSSADFARVLIGEHYRCTWKHPQTLDPKAPSGSGISRQPPR